MTPAHRTGADHLEWLTQAVSAGAVQYDSFEIARHFDVSPGRAVELGRMLHAVANSGCALATVERVELLVAYRSASGAPRRLTVAFTEDGRLEPPTFT